MNRRDGKAAKGIGEPADGIDAFASSVLQASVEVHRVLGPGFSEGIYEEALAIELTSRRVSFVRQLSVAVSYKNQFLGDMRLDFLVARCLVVELKSVDQLAPVHFAQTLSYLKATRLPLALLINFNVPVLLRGVRRVVSGLPPPESP
ncbi:MAG TPA: GxxExxY protein [Polyangiaceae bacterium]|jgi:GxxExxY protein|nr:GxxExxY protein [Polyangiaceae bacterium]